MRHDNGARRNGTYTTDTRGLAHLNILNSAAVVLYGERVNNNNILFCNSAGVMVYYGADVGCRYSDIVRKIHNNYNIMAQQSGKNIIVLLYCSLGSLDSSNEQTDIIRPPNSPTKPQMLSSPLSCLLRRLAKRLII